MFQFLFALVAVFAGTGAVHAQSSHVWNDGAGSGQCFDVVNHGVNDQVRMASCVDVTGQYWGLSRMRGPGRTFQLTNRFTGPSRCLDATGEGLRLRSCDGSPTRHWSSEWPVSG